MTKFVIAMILVGALLTGSLMALLRNWQKPIASPEVLERAKQRNREQEEAIRQMPDDGLDHVLVVVSQREHPGARGLAAMASAHHEDAAAGHAHDDHIHIGAAFGA
jgi:hypothetical protein